MKFWWLKALAWFVFAAVPATLLCILIYGVGQQGYRQGATDVPAQIAADAATQLSQGITPAQIIGEYGRGLPLQDLSTAYSPWVAIYDASGKGLESTGQLYGAPPQPPPGVFTESWWWSGGHTWQPQAGLRFNLSVVRYTAQDGTKGFVVAGQSLAPAEQHTSQLGHIVFAVWLFILFATLVASVVINFALYQLR